jgi:hypothetical protein
MILPPVLNDLPFDEIDNIDGYQTIGLIQKYYPNITCITLSDFIKNGITLNNNAGIYEWLDHRIDSLLSDGQTVYIMPSDEAIMGSPNAYFSNVLNQYNNDDVYLITELDDITYYTEEHNIRCKILELPWIILNDCLAFHYILNNNASTYKQYFNLTHKKKYNKNYLCMIGRVTYGQETHKIDLIEYLDKFNLATFGEITIQDSNDYANLPPNIQQICKVNHHAPYTEYDRNTSISLEGTNTKFHNANISYNTKNFFHILKEYTDIPLIIHPETTTGIFPSTEKSTWPILIGKLFLIYGRPGCTQWIQRFYDADISSFINTSYDNIDGWNSLASLNRLGELIKNNKDLITNADDIYQDMHPDLFDLGIQFTNNIYKFFISQINSTLH